NKNTQFTVMALLLLCSSLAPAVAQMVPEGGPAPLGTPPPGVAPPYVTPPEPFPTPGVLPNGGIGLGNPWAPQGQNPLGGAVPDNTTGSSGQFTAAQGAPGTSNGPTQGNWYGWSANT